MRSQMTKSPRIVQIRHNLKHSLHEKISVILTYCKLIPKSPNTSLKEYFYSNLLQLRPQHRKVLTLTSIPLLQNWHTTTNLKNATGQMARWKQLQRQVYRSIRAITDKENSGIGVSAHLFASKSTYTQATAILSTEINSQQPNGPNDTKQKQVRSSRCLAVSVPEVIRQWHSVRKEKKSLPLIEFVKGHFGKLGGQ